MSVQDTNNNSPQTIVVVQESQAAAAIMAFFFSGIGQMTQGRILAGLLWLFNDVVLGIPLLIMSLGFGLFFTFPTRVLCIVDAATYKSQSGKDLGMLPIIGFCLNLAGLILTIMVWSSGVSK